jgi:hypothetical protein
MFLIGGAENVVGFSRGNLFRQLSFGLVHPLHGQNALTGVTPFGTSVDVRQLSQEYL